jgi:hypothetical protein
MNTENVVVIGVAAAAAAVGIGTGEASAGTLYTQSSFVGVGEATQFVALSDGEIHRPPRTLAAWGSGAIIPAGPATREVQIDPLIEFDSYALIGLDQSGGVLVTFSNPQMALGRSFESVFPGFSEPALADALRNDPFGQLVSSFLIAVDNTPGVGTPMNVQCATVHFSNGADYGSFTASFAPIPAPGAALLLVLSAGMVSRRRRSGSAPV